MGLLVLFYLSQICTRFGIREAGQNSFPYGLFCCYFIPFCIPWESVDSAYKGNLELLKYSW